ncbi:MAG: DEAD/DEAH box helicase family protein [Roseovarius sp.]|nr:DEAD/DEAH box helicase family protein [Roseovarius sp.]
MREYQKFARESVNGSANTAALKRNLAKDDNRIIVSTIQKLNNLMKSEETLDAYNQRAVFMFDECHRGQFGEAQRNLKRKFKRFCQFGFTGTSIFPENAAGAATTCAFEIGRAAARKLGDESERRTNLKCSAWRKIQATENKSFSKKTVEVRKGKRGRVTKSEAHNLHDRLVTYAPSVPRFITDPDVRFTNNPGRTENPHGKSETKSLGMLPHIPLRPSPSALSYFI